MSRRDWQKLGVVILVFVAAVALVTRLDSYQDREETDIVQQAVHDVALTCYAVEGAYPDDISYLREHYHLSYDEDRFFISYEPFSSNIMPDIWVTERGQTIP